MSELLLPSVDADVPPEGLSISEVSALTGLSIETLRYYEREGLLLRPTPRDPGRRRRYDDRDVAWVAGLVMLRETGMGIADLRVIADLSRREGTEAQRLAFFEEHRDRVRAQIRRTRQHLAAIEQKITAYREVVEKETP